MSTPTLETHIPIVVTLPRENDALAVGRPDIPPPSIWQKGSKVVRKLDGKEAVVNIMDFSTMMFRAYYPDEPGDEKDDEGKPILGRFAKRTEWEHCREWNVSVTLSPKELERQRARELLRMQIERLDPKELAWVQILCDSDDPTKDLAKLEALRAAGVIKADPIAVQAALDEGKTEPVPAKKGR